MNKQRNDILLDNPHQKENNKVASSEEFGGSKILVVDDDPITRACIDSKLSEIGYLCTQASSGIEALLLAEKIEPDLILLDIEMNGMNGLETCNRIRNTGSFNAVPIIFLSGRTQKKDIILGLESGATDYIAKPFDIDEAIARIRANLKIRFLNKAKDKLLGIASHDLRNPIGSIRGMSEFLLHGQFGDINPKQQQVIEQILNASIGMLDIVNDLLDLSILEDRDCKLTKTKNDFRFFIHSLIEQNAVIGIKKNISVILEELPEGRINLTYDERFLRRVVHNLISNAIKFSPAGSSIHVRIVDEENIIQLEVLDEGPGVPEDEQYKLFKEYGQTSVQSTAGESSTGLGLSICKKIIKAHNGTIGMTNMEPSGSKFYFSLPKF